MTLAEMAQAIVASRREFGEIFLQAQVEFKIIDRDRFEAIGLSANDARDFEAALRVASNKGWLPLLLKLLIDSGRHDGSLLLALQQLEPNNLALQAITNPQRGVGQTAADLAQIAGAMQWMAKVIVNDPVGGVAGSGTGVLVGAHLVLTAWHVVSRLFTVNAQGQRTATPDSHKQLSVVFDYRLAEDNTPLKPETVQAHPNWCVAFSECHADELVSSLPQNLTQLDGKWDFVVIRLAGTPGRKRRWALLSDDAVVPAARSRVLLFQHAAGQLLTWDQGAVAPAAPGLTNIVPTLRFLHDINTLGGASGGPCFDKTYKLFGIHQGAWRMPASGGGAANGANDVNRGVPISHVRDSIFKQVPALPSPNFDDSLVWQLVPAPDAAALAVIGCDAIQTLTWRAVDGAPRIILIRGDSASGKTFRLDMLASLLPESGHLKVPLRANEELRKAPLELAKTICQAASATLRDIELPTDAVSTSAEWVKNGLVPAVIDALKKARGGRVIWLLLRDMNRATTVHDGSIDFLLQLCESGATEDWLRFVLDGSPRDVPVTVETFRVVTECSAPNAKDLEDYLRRAIAASGHTTPDDQIRLLAELTIATDFPNYRAEHPASALLLLGKRLEQIRQAIERGLT
jgi:hypothetical protein